MNRRKYSLERLEAREMMAGDVFAYVENTRVYGSLVSEQTLFVQESPGQADQANSVIIQQIGDDTLRVSGHVTSDGTRSLINGAAYQDFKFTAKANVNLNVNFGGGDDTVIITGIDSASAVPLEKITVDVGKSGAIDRDMVLVTYVHALRGDLSVATGDGDDWVFLYDNWFNSWGPHEIYTGAGSDQVDVYNTTFGGDVTINTTAYATGADNDRLRMNNVLINSDLLDVRMGEGTDTLDFDNVEVDDNVSPGNKGFGDIRIDMGGGNDSGTIRNSSTQRIRALMGDGNDTLVLDRVYVNELDLQGQGGTDSLTKSNLLAVDRVFESGWEYINGRPAWWWNNLYYSPFRPTMVKLASFG